MVVSLSFVHPKGTNVAGRYWPHQGHLGLTPLTISGIVRARRENDYSFSTPASHNQQQVASSSSSSSASSSSSSSSNGGHKSFKASHITVSLRCYEARLGRVGVVRTNVLYEHTLLLWAADPSSRPASSGNSPSLSSSGKRRMATTATAETEPVAPVAMLPQTDFPFNIVIPPASAGGCSTCHLQSYRVYWRLETSEFQPFNTSCPFWGGVLRAMSCLPRHDVSKLAATTTFICS